MLYQNETANIGLLKRKILYVLYIFIFDTCTLHINTMDHLEENTQVRVQLRMFHVKLLKKAVRQILSIMQNGLLHGRIIIDLPH